MRDLTVVFDLDGTLVETAPDLVGALNHAIATIGEAPVLVAEARQSVTFGSRAMIEQALGRRGISLAAREVDRLQVHFLEHYAANIAVASHPFPGVEEALRHLGGAGARLAVCTNKQEHHSRLLLETLGLAPLFKAIAGRDTFPVMKPHPGHLTGAIRLAGGDPALAIMVGDSETDIATAKAAGIPVVAVTFGYTDRPVEQLAPDAVIDHYQGLVPALERIRPAKRHN